MRPTRIRAHGGALGSKDSCPKPAWLFTMKGTSVSNILPVLISALVLMMGLRFGQGIARRPELARRSQHRLLGLVSGGRP